MLFELPGLGVGAGAGAAGAGLPPVPPALLRLIPQIKAARGNDDEVIARVTIKSAWDGTLNILTSDRERSTAILKGALPVFIARSSRIYQGQGWGSDEKMRNTAGLAIGVSLSLFLYS